MSEIRRSRRNRGNRKRFKNPNSKDKKIKEKLERNKNKKTKKILINIVEIILLCIIAYNIYSIVTYKLSLVDQEKERNKISKIKEEIISKNSSKEEKDKINIVEYLKKDIPDIVGYVKVPGTKIDYPVVRTKDNSYYLNHNERKKKTNLGAIFMDYRNKDEKGDYHKIIYAHNTKDGSNFGDLRKYLNAEYTDKNRKVYYTDNLGKESEYEIFAVFRADATDLTHLKMIKNEKEFNSWMEKGIKNKKDKIYLKDASFTDVVTLTTCNSLDSRIVVIAKKIGDTNGKQ